MVRENDESKMRLFSNQLFY